MRRLMVGAAVMLLVAACGDAGAEPAADASQEGATTTAPPTTAPRATAPATTAMDMTDDTMHDDSMSDDTMHDDSMTDDTMHDDENAHADEATAGAPSGPVDRTIEIDMTDFAFAPDAILVGAGETVRFELTNSGAIEHEFRLSTPHRIEEHLAAGHEHHETEGGHHEGGDVFVTVAAGDSGELVVEFPDDTTVYTEMACLIEGHYEAGMSGAVLYEE